MRRSVTLLSVPSLLKKAHSAVFALSSSSLFCRDVALWMLLCVWRRVLRQQKPFEQKLHFTLSAIDAPFPFSSSLVFVWDRPAKSISPDSRRIHKPINSLLTLRIQLSFSYQLILSSTLFDGPHCGVVASAAKPTLVFLRKVPTLRTLACENSPLDHDARRFLSRGSISDGSISKTSHTRAIKRSLTRVLPVSRFSILLWPQYFTATTSSARVILRVRMATNFSVST